MGSIATTVNASPASAAAYLFNLITTLLAAGWVRKGSSDGTSFDNTGAVDHWPDAAHVNHAAAWWRGRDPGGVAEIAIQFDGTTSIRLKYSNSAKFSGGSPSATQVPSSTDEQVPLGGGTDGSPSYLSVMPGSIGTQQVYADGVNAPYPFYSIGYPNGGGNPNHSIVYDAISGAESGDTDLIVIWGNASTSFKAGALTDAASTGCPQGWLYLDIPMSKGYVPLPMLQLIDNATPFAPGGGVNSPRSAKDPSLAITYARSNILTAPQGYKGVSTLFRWACVPHATPQQGTVASSGDHEIAGDLVCVWSSSAGAWA